MLDRGLDFADLAIKTTMQIPLLPENCQFV